MLLAAFCTNPEVTLSQAGCINGVESLWSHPTCPHTRPPRTAMRHGPFILQAVDDVAGFVDHRLVLLLLCGSGEQLGGQLDYVCRPSVQHGCLLSDDGRTHCLCHAVRPLKVDDASALPDAVLLERKLHNL